MEEWEYCSYFVAIADTDHVLNADPEWELVSALFIDRTKNPILLIFKRKLGDVPCESVDNTPVVVQIGKWFAVRKKLEDKFVFLDIPDALGNEYPDPNWKPRLNGDEDEFGFCLTIDKQEAFKALDWLINKTGFNSSFYGTPVTD